MRIALTSGLTIARQCIEMHERGSAPICILEYTKVNPRQARGFAEATGKIAKTDKFDAEMLARMGAILQLEPQEPKVEY